MKIRITDLPTDGLNLKETLNIESLANRLKDDKNTPFTLFDAPQVEIRLLPLGQNGAQVSGFINASYKQDCALCLEPAQQTVRIPVDFQIRIKPSEAETSDDFEDDVGMVFVADENVILDDSLEEIFILSLDLFWRPSFVTLANKDEACSICKKTRQQIGILEEAPKSTLGDLLSKSALKKPIQ